MKDSTVARLFSAFLFGVFVANSAQFIGEMPKEEMYTIGDSLIVLSMFIIIWLFGFSSRDNHS